MKMLDKKTGVWKRRMAAADVYDCYSLKAAEKAGYDAVYLSVDGIAECVCGLEDADQLSLEEFLWSARRIVSFAELPVIAQIKSGFGSRAEDAALAAMRLAKAGVDAVWIDDSSFQKQGSRISQEEWGARVRKVQAALQKYSCRMICTITDGWESLEEAAARCSTARELGADLVGVCGLWTAAGLEQYAALVSDPKVWMPEGTGRGITSGTKAEMVSEMETRVVSGTETRAISGAETEMAAGKLWDLGYELILDRYSAESAREGMELFGQRTQEDKNTVYHDQHDFDGMLPSRSHYDLFEFYKTWIPLEQHFLDAAGQIAADETSTDRAAADKTSADRAADETAVNKEATDEGSEG